MFSFIYTPYQVCQGYNYTILFFAPSRPHPVYVCALIIVIQNKKQNEEVSMLCRDYKERERR